MRYRIWQRRCGSSFEVKLVPIAASQLQKAWSLVLLSHVFGLRGDEMGATGATAIAESLKLNPSLRQLNLLSQQFGSDRAAAIAESLKVNSTL
jgi:hypothetical protein